MNTKEYIFIIFSSTISSVTITIILIDYIYKMGWGFVRWLKTIKIFKPR